jgi:hypothetical protein
MGAEEAPGAVRADTTMEEADTIMVATDTIMVADGVGDPDGVLHGVWGIRTMAIRIIPTTMRLPSL